MTKNPNRTCGKKVKNGAALPGGAAVVGVSAASHTQPTQRVNFFRKAATSAN